MNLKGFLSPTERYAANEQFVSRQPLAFVCCMIWVLSTVGGLVFVFAFSDNADERWHHFWESLAVVVPAAVLFAVATISESKGLIGVGVRRWVWRIILLTYFGAVFTVVLFALSGGFKRERIVYLVARLGATVPVPIIAWQFLKRDAGKE